MAKIKKINRGNSGKGKAPKAKKKTSSKQAAKVTIKKRDYTRSPYQKKARYGNDKLRELESLGVHTDKTRTIVHTLEKMNEDINKKGRKDRFYSGNDLSEQDRAIFESMILELSAEIDKIKKELKSEDRKKQDDLSDQDYIDQNEMFDDFTVHAFDELGLSSQQKRDIYQIAKDKGIHTDQINEIIRAYIEKEYPEVLKQGKGFKDINPDPFAAFVRKELYKLWYC